MRTHFLNAEGRQHGSSESLNEAFRRLGFAAVSMVCLIISISLLYGVTALHFARESWAFLHVPRSDPGALADTETLALLLVQIAGGITSAIAFLGTRNIRRTLKWSPLFLIAFTA